MRGPGAVLGPLGLGRLGRLQYQQLTEDLEPRFIPHGYDFHGPDSPLPPIQLGHLLVVRRLILGP